MRRRPSLTYANVGRMPPEQVMHSLKIEDARLNPRDVQFGVLNAVADRLGLSRLPLGADGLDSGVSVSIAGPGIAAVAS